MRAGKEFTPKPPPGGKPGGPFRLSAPGVLETSFASARVEVSATGEVNCPFEYESWVRSSVEPLTSDDGSITFETNVFVYVVGQA